MLSTELTAWHQKNGARMTNFAGYNMPVSYTGINDEHLHVRDKAGLFDVSHMGEFFIEGTQAMELIQLLTTNDVSSLQDGQAQYSCMLMPDGGIIDDLIVYKFNPHKWMLVVNAGNCQKDWEWINEQNTMNASLRNVSLEMSLFALQGPLATTILSELTDYPLGDLPYYHFDRCTLAGREIILSATGYTGAGGFELYIDNKDAQYIWELIMSTGQPKGLVPVGLGARDTLRLEMGYCLYGNDIDYTINPIEAGLSWIVKFKKDFIGKAALLDYKSSNNQRKLMGFVMADRAIPRHNFELYNALEEKIGHVTSGTQSPSLGKGIGMGYVSQLDLKPGDQLYVDIRRKKMLAHITKLPFIPKQ